MSCQHSEGHSEQGGKPRHMPSGGTSAGRTEGTSHGTEARGSVAWRWPQWAPSTGSGCPRDKCPPTATDTRSFKRLKPAPEPACHDGRFCIPSPTERGGHRVLLTTLFFPCMHAYTGILKTSSVPSLQFPGFCLPADFLRSCQLFLRFKCSLSLRSLQKGGSFPFSSS